MSGARQELRSLLMSLPLPLGEAQGEGLASGPNLFGCVCSASEPKKEKDLFLMLTSYAPHPGPLPKGE